MKTTRILSMAALVLAGAILTGCSNKNNEEPERDNIVTLTTTVSFASDEGASAPERAMGEGVEPMMRVLAADGKKTFAVGDRIDVVYINNLFFPTLTTSNPLTSKDISADGKSANFTVSFTNPNKEEKTAVKCFYPTGKVNVEGELDPKYPWLDEQDGTLASLSSNEDFCSNVSEWDGTALPSLNLDNYLTIGKLTIKNNSGTDITSSITRMTIKVSSYTYTISRVAAAGPIWVAMRPCDSQNITFIATDGTNYYEKTVTSKTLSVGNIYPINLTMNKYTRVDYLQSTGTQYINTGVQCDYGDKVEIDFMYTESQVESYPGSNDGSHYWKEGGSVFGAHGNQQANGIYEYCIWWHGTGLITNTSSYTTALFALNTRYNVKITSSTKAVINDVEYTTTDLGQSNNAGCNFALFANYSTMSSSWTYFSYARIYSCKIWNESGTLLRHFVPCIHDTDGNPGMYDIVNDTFYPNEGTGEFVTPTP